MHTPHSGCSAAAAMSHHLRSASRYRINSTLRSIGEGWRLFGLTTAGLLAHHGKELHHVGPQLFAGDRAAGEFLDNRVSIGPVFCRA